MASLFKTLLGLLKSDQKEIPTHVGGTVMGAGILTRKEIEERGLILNPVDKRMQATSYDLSLGCDYLGEHEDGKPRSLSENEQLTIPQYGVVLVCTKESVKTDAITAGRFDLKIRHALSGLVLQVGTQVEPNYTGQLFGLILNLSDQPVIIYESESIFTIEFHTLASPVDGNERTVSSLGEFLQIKNIKNPVRSSLSRVRKDILADLNENLKREVVRVHARWEQEIAQQQARRDQKWVNGVVIAFSAFFLLISLFFGIFFPVWINKTTFDRDDTLLQQLRNYKAQQALQDDQSSPALIKYLREHPDELKKLLEEVKSIQSTPTPAPSIPTNTQKP